MTAATARSIQFLNPFHRPAGALDLTPLTRGIVMVAGTAMTALCVLAIARGMLGLTPDLPHLGNIAVVIHVTTVVPCVPLGLFLLLAPKGTAMHKQLGKLWVALMVVTATSTLWIHGLGNFTWIHIFVPMTYRAAWLIVSSARKGDMKQHRNEIVGLFLGALMIPGVFAFVLDGRLMNVMTFG
ncbi:DUF2306 domain-containing protein [Aurantiacibacter aquimixticola]|uniref:DUF2306 domain-containing protein n=1 Tax=Aurantiacibacter aquimixticola TaxID=1958945 RepID=A0A419RWX8_9SPHN|nr:DUF2306 domain-containing protein [Aurantiacibacter aquimixticola]RJY10273.1 DUF2306 domain-containing protein [Aurantiacibacter aquimixticola]